MKRSLMMSIIGGIIVVAGIAIGWNYSASTQATDDVDTTKQQQAGPTFVADSAYAYIQKQCEFGPRTMNSVAHEQCGQWIANKFKSFGCVISLQKANLKGYDGTILKSTNIIAKFKPKAQKRIVICAHWDSRPWADNDPVKDNWQKPVMAANDGASGVAVMLEIARLLQKDSTFTYGIDFVCFDAEDWGTPQWKENQNSEDTWALGAQYWAKNLPQGYQPEYALLLDMVGGLGAKFYQELASKQYATSIVDKVWAAAQNVGYGSFFVLQDGGYITDDHIPLNEIAKIPTIDIIPYYPDCPQGAFGPTWHTIHDTIENIDVNTLQAVGQTVIQTLFNS